MDLNDQNQYQNLSYTFQNLALSPPPPPPVEPPYSGLSDPYDSSSNPVFCSSPSGDYSSFMANSSSSSSQKIGQSEGPEGAGYAPSDDGIAQGKSMNTSCISSAGAGSRTGGSGIRAGSGEGGMGSVGRGGWGSSNGSVGSVNGNGNPGSIQSVNRGRMGRAELPSQWLDQPFHNPSPNGRSPVGFVSFQQQQQQQQQQLQSSSQHQSNGRPGQQRQQQQQYQLGDSTSTGSMSPPIVHPSQNSTFPVSPLLSSEYVNSHSQSVGDSSYNSYGSSALSSSPGTSRASINTGNTSSNGNYYSSSPTSITGFTDVHQFQNPPQLHQHHQLPNHVHNHHHHPPPPPPPPHMSIGAHLTPNNSLHPSLSNSTGLGVGPGARRYQVFGNGIPTGLIGGPGPGPGPAGGQSWGGPAMVPGLGVGPGGPFAMMPATGGGMDDDVIPTAIVIKNINFNLQKEDLLRTIESLGAPLPYAFNYHMDQGVFRGLAFANFRSAHEADAVVAALNGYDVGGRKLRVEYKKVLQAGEKERIEREKALRRMRSIQQPQGTSSDNHHQQQQQPRPSTGSMPSVSTPVDEYPGIQPVSLGLGLGASVSPNGGHAQYSQHQQQQAGNQLLHRERSGSGEAQGMNGLGIPTVQVTAQRDSESSFYSQQEMDGVGAGSDSGESSDSKSTELDLNDPITLDIYSRILVFKEDRMRDELAFSRTLSALQRRVVHLVAQKLGVYHYSVGEGDKRYAVVTRSEGRVGGSGDRTLRHHTSRPNLPTHQMNQNSHNHQGHHQHQHLQANQNLYASSPSLRSKSSMPDLSHLHGPAVSRDPTRAIAPQRSSSNLRDNYSLMGSISNGIGGRAGVSSVHPRRSTTNPIDHGFLNPQMIIPSYHGTLLKQASESTESLISSDGMSASVGQLGSSSSSSNGGGGGGGMSQSMAALLRQPRAPGGGQNSGGFGVFRRFGMPGSVEKHQLSGEKAFNTTQEPLEL